MRLWLPLGGLFAYFVMTPGTPCSVDRMPVYRPVLARIERMPILRPDSLRVERMPIARPLCSTDPVSELKDTVRGLPRVLP